MCDTCGCGDPERVSVDVHERILSDNDRRAEHNRAHFGEHDVLAINLMGSPGSGKTALLEATAAHAESWSLAAVSGENGAFAFWHDAQAGKIVRRYQHSVAVRADRRTQLEAIAKNIIKAVPGCALAADQAYRETDLAIDYCEDVPALPQAAAERIAALMREAGLTAKLSSIHVNGWFGAYDKLTMCKTLCVEHFGVDLEADQRAWAFVGDSPNDAPMFAFFDHSVGVANVARFADRLAAEPKFVTLAPAGAGFAELAAHLLKGA